MSQSKPIQPPLRDLPGHGARLGVKRSYVVTASALLVMIFAAVCWGVRGPEGKDYVELALLTRYALTHGSPYHPHAARSAYMEVGLLTAPADEPFPGFIYPPALIPVVVPIAFLPLKVGAAVWFAVLTALAVLAAFALVRLEPSPWGDWVAVVGLAVLFASAVTQSAFLVGQTAMVVAAGVAVGAASLAAGRPLLAAVGWALIAVKPQLGIPFLFTAACAGWRGIALAAAGAAGLTLLGAAMTGEPLVTLRSYLPHASETVFQIEYNRVTNDQIVGWNRAVYVLTGREINLSALGMIAGYAVFGGLAWARAFVSGARSSLAYWLAVAAIAGPLCGQAKGYDLVLLLLWLPYLTASRREGRWADVIVFLAAAVVIALPRGVVVAVVPPETFAGAVALSYRTWATLGLAGWLLVRGPVCARGATAGG